MTVFRDPFLQAPTGEALFYLPIRYNKEKWTYEFDLLKGFGAASSGDDSFSSLRVTYEFVTGFNAGVAVQNYRGQTGRFLGTAKALTGGNTAGIRLEYTGGLSL